MTVQANYVTIKMFLIIAMKNLIYRHKLPEPLCCDNSCYKMEDVICYLKISFAAKIKTSFWIVQIKNQVNEFLRFCVNSTTFLFTILDT